MTIHSHDVTRMLAGRARLGELASLFSPGLEPPPPLSPAARRELRKKLFAETMFQRSVRFLKAGRAALVRDGLGGCLRAVELMIRDKSIGAIGLPDPERALASPEGLCGVADDLSVATVMAAYEHGLYPSAHFGPMKWWSPHHRAIVQPAALAKRLAGADVDGATGATVAFDMDFETAVCDGDAETPTPPRLKWAFATLFDAGFAHSFVIVSKSGEKIGGGFGVAVGRVFVIEALTFVDDASRRAGLAALAAALDERDFALVDAKRLTPELAACGFDETPRVGYAQRLRNSIGGEKVGRWVSPHLREAA